MTLYEYQRSRSLTLVKDHSDSTFSNFFSLETAKPIEAKFYVAPPWDGGTKVCSNGLGHMTRWPSFPYMAKTLKNLLLWNQKADDLEVDMHHQVLKYYQVYSNDDLGLTMTYFTAMSNFVPYAFI